MSARVGIAAAALEPLEREELADLVDALYRRLGVKPADVLAVSITSSRVTLRLKVRSSRGRTLARSWAHVHVDVLERGASDE